MGEPTNLWYWIKSIEKYALLACWDDNQSKRLDYQTSRGAFNDYIQRYMVENPGNSLEQLKYCEYKYCENLLKEI